MSVPGAIILTNNNPQLIRPYCTNGSLQFYWTAPISDGGSPIRGYILREISPGTSSTTLGETIFSTRITSLTNGTEYSYEIAAFNDNGTGPYSQFRIVQPGNKPGPVYTLEATINSNIITLIWTPPTTDGGATVKWYVIKGYNSLSGTMVVNNSVPGYTTEKIYYGLGVDYFINAVNDPGYSPTIGIPASLITLVASKYSGSGIWYNSSQYSDTTSGATLALGTVLKNPAGNGIVLNGSSYWTFPNIEVGPIWSVGTWYKNKGIPSGIGASIVTQQYTGGAINLILGYSVFGNTGGPVVGSFLTSVWTVGTEITPFINGDWNNIFITYDGTTLSTYVNGTLLGTVGSGEISTDGGGQYRIGSRWDQSSYIVGEIGELTIYRGAMTPYAITNYYNRTSSAYPNNPTNVYVPILSLIASSYSGSGLWQNTTTLPGTVAGASLASGTIAKNGEGNGIILDGSTYWTFPNVGAGSVWTLAVWFKNTGSPVGDTYPCIVTQEDGEVDSISFINMLLVYPNNNYPELQAGFFRSDPAFFYLGSPYTVPNNIWTYYTITYDGDNLTTYINGTSTGFTKHGIASRDSGLQYRIGRRWDVDSYIVGEIGEVTIYNTVLDPSAISQRFNATRSTYGV